MKAFDVTLKGFNAETDGTDHLVHWVKASSLEVVNRWLEASGLTPHLHTPPYEMTEYSDSGRFPIDYEDGVDIVLDDDGTVRSGPKLPENWLEGWIEESRKVLARAA